MFRAEHFSSFPPSRWQDSCIRLLAPLALWLCASVSLQYGYYGTRQIVLGPSASRLVETSPLFVKEIEVIDEAQKGVLIYGFSERPELNLAANWTSFEYLIVGSYSSKGFSLWLNEGSRIRIRWKTQSRSLKHLQVVVIKGERKYEKVLPDPDAEVSSTSPSQGEEAEYSILEDNKYYVSVVNINQQSIIMTMEVNVTSKMYDTSKAKSMCSTMNGSCQLAVIFPSTRFLILTTPNNGDFGGSYIELSFVARVVTFIAILGLFFIIIFLILKYLGVCNCTVDDEEEDTTHQEIRGSQTMLSYSREIDPLMPEKPIGTMYGTGDEDPESGRSSSDSADELYDGKICAICYDGPRNCFYVPCGHCATCYECAQRIMEGETKTCPICRRLIHKVRKLFTS